MIIADKTTQQLDLNVTTANSSSSFSVAHDLDLKMLLADTEAAANNATLGPIHLSSLFSRFTTDFFGTLLLIWAEVRPFITWPLIFVLLFPLLICSLVLISSFILYLHQKSRYRVLIRIRDALIDEGDMARAGREVIATLWDFIVSGSSSVHSRWRSY